jgi:predicted nuclease of restriction endonuclease-like (RecB) superfamily
VTKFELAKWPPVVAKLTWGHNVILLEKCKNPQERAWYARAALEHGWGRNALVHQIESELHNRPLDHIQRFLIELGVGFAFVGRQVHLEVEGEDFYIDLLFYHLRLRRFVVIELKNGPFKPEYAGKMNFYLSAVDDLLRHKEDRASIGMILCKSRKKLIAEYALRDTHKPIGVSAFTLTKALPKKLKGTLPTIKDLEAELG